MTRGGCGVCALRILLVLNVFRILGVLQVTHEQSLLFPRNRLHVLVNVYIEFKLI